MWCAPFETNSGQYCLLSLGCKVGGKQKNQPSEDALSGALMLGSYFRFAKRNFVGA